MPLGLVGHSKFARHVSIFLTKENSLKARKTKVEGISNTRHFPFESQVIFMTIANEQEFTFKSF